MKDSGFRIYDLGFVNRNDACREQAAVRQIDNQKSEIRNHQFLHSAFTLLEIVLALAILAGSLAVIGEVARLANRNAQLASDEAQAQMLAATVMSELLSGARDLAAIDGVPFTEIVSQPRWLCSIRIEQLSIEELVMVSVLVYQELPLEKEPAKWELVRWFANPDYLPTTQGSSTSQTESAESSQ